MREREGEGERERERERERKREREREREILVAYVPQLCIDSQGRILNLNKIVGCYPVLRDKHPKTFHHRERTGEASTLFLFSSSPLPPHSSFNQTCFSSSHYLQKSTSSIRSTHSIHIQIYDSFFLTIIANIIQLLLAHWFAILFFFLAERQASLLLFLLFSRQRSCSKGDIDPAQLFRKHPSFEAWLLL